MLCEEEESELACTRSIKRCIRSDVWFNKDSIWFLLYSIAQYTNCTFVDVSHGASCRKTGPQYELCVISLLLRICCMIITAVADSRL